MIYIAVLSNSTESLQNRSTILPLFIGPYAAARVRRFSKKALARYQVGTMQLGEQKHIRCEQLAQGCCPNNATVGVEPATFGSRVQRPTATLPSHQSTCTSKRSVLVQAQVLRSQVQVRSTTTLYFRGVLHTAWSVILTSCISTSLTSLGHPMHLHIVAQFTTMSSQHRQVFD